jgi:hypothetical protein
MSEKETTREQAARRIAALLAQAESAAELGNAELATTCLEKAAALKFKYDIDSIVQGRALKEEIETRDFCTESNTPLIKAKRDLISALANLYRGKPVMMGEWRTNARGERKYDRRARIRVWAYSSDLVFIEKMFLSLLLQLQSAMGRDERQLPARRGTASWRVSYAHAWVDRVTLRLFTAQDRDQHAASQATPGAALALRDRGGEVARHVESTLSDLRKGRKTRRSEGDVAGWAAGDQAGRVADLGNSAAIPGEEMQELEA